jgi:hypothetical protein
MNLYSFAPGKKVFKKFTEKSLLLEGVVYNNKLYATGYSPEKPGMSIYEFELSPATVTITPEPTENISNLPQISYHEGNYIKKVASRTLKPLLYYPYVIPTGIDDSKTTTLSENTLKIGVSAVNSDLLGNSYSIISPYVSTEKTFGITANLAASYYDTLNIFTQLTYDSSSLLNTYSKFTIGIFDRDLSYCSSMNGYLGITTDYNSYLSTYTEMVYTSNSMAFAFIPIVIYSFTSKTFGYYVDLEGEFLLNNNTSLSVSVYMPAIALAQSETNIKVVKKLLDFHLGHRPLGMINNLFAETEIVFNPNFKKVNIWAVTKYYQTYYPYSLDIYPKIGISLDEKMKLSFIFGFKL